jgi:hypothetical protein
VKQIIDFLYFSLGGEICYAPNSGINHHQYDKPNGYANDRMGKPIQNIGNKKGIANRQKCAQVCFVRLHPSISHIIEV